MARGCIANAQLFQGDLHGYIENAIGGRGNDLIYGNLVNNALSGHGGNDLMAGGPGKDLLAGGLGKDTLSGGTGPDRFDFNAAVESRPGAALRDIIRDFHHAQGDRIDLSTIDADQRPGHAGNQAFVYIGAQTFDHYHHLHPGTVGMLRFAHGVVEANVNGNLAADFAIAVTGVASLGAGDFVL